MGLLSRLARGAVLMAAPATGTGGDAATRSVTVRLRDYARLDAGLLRVTEAQVSAIYAAIGVVVIWRMPVRPNDVRDGLSLYCRQPLTDRRRASARSVTHARPAQTAVRDKCAASHP